MTLILFYFILFHFFLFRARGQMGAMARGQMGAMARGQMGAVATGLHHSHSNVGSEPCLQPIPQLMATVEP